MSEDNFEGVLVRYRGEEYRVVLGPPCSVQQRSGALVSTGMPSIELVEPDTARKRNELTFDIPYPAENGTERFWIITEADRSVTTVLMPSEY